MPAVYSNPAILQDLFLAGRLCGWMLRAYSRALGRGAADGVQREIAAQTTANATRFFRQPGLAATRLG